MWQQKRTWESLLRKLEVQQAFAGLFGKEMACWLSLGCSPRIMTFKH